MKILKLLTTSICLILIVNINTSFSQQKVTVPMKESAWTVKSDDYKFEEHLGVESLYLNKGFVYLNDVEFHNGIIEFDIAFPVGRGFPGVGFRVQDEQNYEELYVRPHQSGNPDANQYTPVFNGSAGWQLYHGDGHGAPVKYKYDAWNHVKLVIKGTAGEVYINDLSKPLFQIHELKHGDVKGPICFKGSAKAHFANLTYTLDENVTLAIPANEKAPLEETVIQNYEVSNAIPDEDVIGKSKLNIESMDNIQWTKMQPEYTGTINVARVAKKADKMNTALVKINIASETEQVKLLQFGYSDIVYVFVNGKAVYVGQNIFRSRDYRYLGTIGYFDGIFLDLKKGENQVIFALTENFGGWGMKAMLENMDGIQVK